MAIRLKSKPTIITKDSYGGVGLFVLKKTDPGPQTLYVRNFFTLAANRIINSNMYLEMRYIYKNSTTNEYWDIELESIIADYQSII